MAKYELGEGAIFMLHAVDPGGGVGSLWHIPPPGESGQNPVDGVYLTQCGQRIQTSAVELLRLPFAIGLDMPDPDHICRDCRF